MRVFDRLSAVAVNPNELAMAAIAPYAQWPRPPSLGEHAGSTFAPGAKYLCWPPSMLQNKTGYHLRSIELRALRDGYCARHRPQKGRFSVGSDPVALGQGANMARRELLSAAEREALLAFPTDESELIRRYALSRADRTFIRQHRSDHNRLGIAIQLCYLRHPGRTLGVDETPPPALVGIVTAQLKASPALRDDYARRDQTRREHQ